MVNLCCPSTLPLLLLASSPTLELTLLFGVVSPKVPSLAAYDCELVLLFAHLLLMWNYDLFFSVIRALMVLFDRKTTNA